MAVPVSTLSAFDKQDAFVGSIRPILVTNCGTCHNPLNSKNPANFLVAQTEKDIEAKRGLWRNVASQIRNRSMPPVASKITEEERLRVATWVENRLRETACNSGPFAGAVAVRRLNRREYHNTIRDLVGVDLPVTELLPADGSGGSGFDTNGETLYIGQLLTERYLEAAQQIVDHAIVSPPWLKTFPAGALIPTKREVGMSRPLAPGEELSTRIAAYTEGDYEVRASLDRTETPPKLELKIDGAAPHPLAIQSQRPFGEGGGGRGARRPMIASATVHLERGTRTVSIVAQTPATLNNLAIEEKQEAPSAERMALHYRLLGSEPGKEPLRARETAQRILTGFVRRAYRRPIEPDEVNRFMALYDRAAKRGDPYEERIKLALKGVLISPDFLFKMEGRHEKPGIYPLGQFEMATRLSYFLWSTMPDDELTRLAEQGKLQDPHVLTEQLDRMLDDPRSHTFTTSFIGQWLGTQDLGGRVVPLVNSVQAFYNAESAADLRQEPVLLFERLLNENRSVLEFLTADYTYLTDRLVKYYQLEDKVKVTGDGFQLVPWPDNRRGGILGMAAPLAITSQRLQTSPVQRGAWVLETILGTPVPPPPPGVPPLPADEKKETALPMRQKLTQHRANPACFTCHQLMDPIGFGLENFDGLGRWREKDGAGNPIDATGTLPSGENFNGPVELRQALFNKKGDFVRHLTGKLLGYALGRSLQDGDSCTVQNLTDAVEKGGYRARTLLREIVLSTPFRNTQGGVVTMEAAPAAPKRTQRIVPCYEDGTCMPLKKPDPPDAKQVEVKKDQK